jgi:hypothetical protein
MRDWRLKPALSDKRQAATHTFTLSPLHLVILLWLFIAPHSLQAQTTSLSTLDIELWPDYDQQNVLALLTGELAADIALPATVTIPLHTGANGHVVARITSDGVMTDDIEPQWTADSVTFTTPDPTFRIEYYFPYTAAGDQRDFTFNWTADFAITQLSISVQQPISASNFTIEPTGLTALGELDGLTYFRLPPQSVAAGEAYVVNVSYQMDGPLLTAVQLQNRTPDQPITTTTPTTTTPSTPNWAPNWALYLAAAGFALVAIAMFWQVYNQRRMAPAVKPRPAARKTPASKAKEAYFCHNCGQPATVGDRFCRSCGTELKTQ